MVHGPAEGVLYAALASLRAQVLAFRNTAAAERAYYLFYYSKSVTDVPVKSRPSDQRAGLLKDDPGIIFSDRR